jgi:hypothetical protein
VKGAAGAVGGVNLALTPGTCQLDRVVDRFPAPAGTYVNGALFAIDPRQLRMQPRFRVVLKGDFIRDVADKAVDADHLPLWLPKRASGDGVEGGTFESWFSITNQ